MVDFAYGSLAHWGSVGGTVRQHRGEWLVSRVHAGLGKGGPALKRAQFCYQLLEDNKSEMDDVDTAFAYEAVARAYAVSGDKKESLKFLEMAKKAGEEIKNDKD